MASDEPTTSAAPLTSAEIERVITDGLCDEAWNGRWQTEGVLNTRPLAQITAEAVSRVLRGRGLEVVRHDCGGA